LLKSPRKTLDQLSALLTRKNNEFPVTQYEKSKIENELNRVNPHLVFFEEIEEFLKNERYLMKKHLEEK
jgi:hypothetical protein